MTTKKLAVGLTLVALALSTQGAWAMGKHRGIPGHHAKIPECNANVILLSFSDQTIEAAYVADQLKDMFETKAKIQKFFSGFSTFHGMIQLSDLGLQDAELDQAIVVRSKFRPWDNQKCLLDISAQTIRNRKFVDFEPMGYFSKLVSCDEPVKDLLTDKSFDDQFKFMIERTCP